MTLQLVKPISMTDIEAEFLAPSGTPLSAFVRGGAFVPDNATNIGVPTAKPIAMTDLLGAANAPPSEVFTMTAGEDSMGALTGFRDGNYGVMAPTDFRGDLIRRLDFSISGSELLFEIADETNPQDRFSTMTIVGPNWNETFESSLADVFVVGGAFVRWEYIRAHADFTIGQNYTIELFF